jgi:Arc/MetJ-type ribon-helix-helix transcriptional regulator
MARVRLPDELRDEIKEYVRNNPEYDTQSDFVKDAVRRLFDKKEAPTSREAIEKIVEEHLDESL